MTYDEAEALIDECETLAGLQAIADGLYETYGDDCEAMTALHPHPWQVPPAAMVVEEGIEDITIRFPSGEMARWVNRDRKWVAA